MGVSSENRRAEVIIFGGFNNAFTAVTRVLPIVIW